MNFDALLPFRDILVQLIKPIARAIDSPARARVLLQELGYKSPIDIQSFKILAAPVCAILDLTEELENTITEENSKGAARTISELLIKFKHFLVSLNEVNASIQQEFANSPFISETDILTELPRRLVDYLVLKFLQTNHRTLYDVLAIIGVVELQNIIDVPTQFHAPYLKHIVNWDLIPVIFSNPINAVKENLNITDEIIYHKVIFLLSQLAVGLGLPGRYFTPDDILLTTINKSSLTIRDDYDELMILQFPLIDDLGASAGIDVYPLIDANSGKYSGLALAIRAGGQVEIPITNDYHLVIEASANVKDGLGVRMPVDGDMSFVSSLFSSPQEVSDDSTFGLKFSIVPTENGLNGTLFSIGSSASTLFEIGSGSLSFGIEKTDALNLFIDAELENGLLVLKSDQADGFIANLLPSDGISGTFNIGIGFSIRAGLYFKGTSSLYIRLPIHRSIGPITIDYMGFSFGFENSHFPLVLTSGFSAALGPLNVAVEDIGVRIISTIKSDRSGNLGPLDISFGFEPPKGVGLSIDAGAVKGGGYLYFNPDEGEYSGALELVVSDFLSLKAIGLISTKMPGGQSKYSLLVIITAEFDPGFQLGFGFILMGVGGLVGLNRSMLLDPLVQGVRTGAVNSILFPTDVVANAPKILSDLQAIFPIHEGTFLIGPMAKINWGSPPLISIMLGVIIEIPGNVVILGNLKAALPTAEDPVLVIQVTFVGALEFDKRRFWFFAKLYESRVLSISIEGEMGLLMDYSDNPNFILSVGGFNPRFKVPALPFPLPSRVTLSIINESWARLRAETYFAITSNTVQMGCRAEAFFGFDDFSLEGYINFDALLRFSPFYLIADISSSYSVKVFGVGAYSVHLKGSLEGPTPWRVRGSASIDFFITSFSVDVDVTFGERRAETLPPIEVLPRLKEEFEKIENWRTKLPDSSRLHVSLRKLGDADALVLHPVGILEISQRFVPLNLPLDKIGNQKPSDIKKATITVLTSALAVKGPAKELFAVAQYRDMDDAAKLSAQSYEPMECGIKLGVAVQPWATGPLAQRHVRYEQVVMDSAFERVPTHHVEYPQRLFAHFCGGAAVTRSPLSQANQKRRQPFAEKVVVSDEQFVVASQMNNRIYQKDAAFSSYAEAQSYMQELIRNDPSIMDEIHVIPSVEVNASKVKTP